MANDQKTKPGVAIWATVVVVVLLVAYPVSFGPACWITSRADGNRLIPKIYWPVAWIGTHSTLSGAIVWYAQLGMPKDGYVYLPTKRGQPCWIITRMEIPEFFSVCKSPVLPSP